jgi:hypothetical protein
MQFFDVITAVTISGILAILVLYILVVYKKGWLKRNGVESHFLCPNPKCRKIFTEPVWLTDLSRTPPESYPACPNCSINLNTIPFFGAQKSPPLKSMKAAPPSFKEFKKPKPIERMQAAQTETPSTKPTIVREVAEPTFSSDISKDWKKPEPLPKSLEKPKVQEEKKPFQLSRDCPHFFGYVKSLPKNTPIPDDCLGCPWIVECLTKAEKVEA